MARWSEGEVRGLLDAVGERGVRAGCAWFAGVSGRNAGSVLSKYYAVLRSGGGAGVSQGVPLGVAQSSSAGGLGVGGGVGLDLSVLSLEELFGLREALEVEVRRRRGLLDSW